MYTFIYTYVIICPDTYLPEWILDEVRTFCTCVQLVDVYFRRLEWTRYNGRLVGVQHHNSTMVHCASAFPADHAYVVRTAVFLFAVSRERSVCCVLLKDFFFIQLWKFAYYYALSTFCFDPWWSCSTWSPKLSWIDVIFTFSVAWIYESRPPVPDRMFCLDSEF